MINLYTYGWNDKLNQLKLESAYKDLLHGRVSIVHRTCYEVISENGIFQCELTGNMMYGKTEFELPCTGDWVIFQPFDESKGIITYLFPRKHTLYRKRNNSISEKQVLASYVDKAFIVQSLDQNFNVRRIERFMVQIMEESIKPVLILNKADLNSDIKKIEESIKHIIHQMPVFITSIHHAESISQLREFISEGETVVFVGSSGVGKSTLINMLCEKPELLTSDISKSTGKGRHTSTRREMTLMNNSGVLIDTPGVREFGLAIDNTEILDEILDISDYTKLCRFTDCTHTNEPGCAVIEAMDNGSLDRKVYESYLKLRRETIHFSTSEHERRKKEKSLSRLIEEVKWLKDNY
ncbi:MAG: ribosome small subunit-dependent GTPase A [Dysgonomonas sp.]|nr:ribosome small subunit-dependent GTPase A [Dysgonomonas sp.]